MNTHYVGLNTYDPVSVEAGLVTAMNTHYVGLNTYDPVSVEAGLGSAPSFQKKSQRGQGPFIRFQYPPAVCQPRSCLY
jgi:hypothetical protein